MTENERVAMWERRAVLMHDMAKDLAVRLALVQDSLKALHMEYEKAVKEGVVLTRALNAMALVANEAQLRHRYCYNCGVAWAATGAQDVAQSGASVCDGCLQKHAHWELESYDKYEVAT